VAIHFRTINFACHVVLTITIYVISLLQLIELSQNAGTYGDYPELIVKQNIHGDLSDWDRAIAMQVFMEKTY
jgi:hypothetical protein